ncbi:MAG: hypothetical protein Roseis2KO_14910 [Roseivirga sp.]
MSTQRKKLIRKVIIAIILVAVAGVSYAGYVFFKPHRDVQSASTDFTLQSSTIVAEYLANPDRANEKYLDDAGLSKILEVTGTVASITEDYNNQKVVLLKSAGDKAGVSATFTTETNTSAEALKIGQTVKIKGVIRSGASYNDDLEFYENVIMEKSDVVQ